MRKPKEYDVKWYKLRKKPITIRGRPFTGDPEDPDVIVTAMLEHGSVVYGFVVETPNGPVNIRPGEWIIEGIAGELYPIDYDIMLKTYDMPEGINKP